MMKNKHPSYLLHRIILSALISIGVYFYYKSLLTTAIALVVSFIIITLILFIKHKLKRYNEIKRMEEVFPDFIQLMASNLRAGITIDKALLMSSRKEFAPLDVEIISLGKDIVTGKEIDKALLEMAKRINSEKINKTISLIISGIRSGGNLAVLLEETAVNMRERDFVEKRASSNVLMYNIFIFFAVAFGSPTLFALSSVLVQILTTLFSTIPPVEATSSMPFTLTSISVSPKFITYFSILFIISTDILASLVLGLVSKNEEKEGLKYAIPIVSMSLAVFFIVKNFMTSYFSEFFG